MNTRSPQSAPNQAGFTLIEIMIALLIGAFLLSGIIQIFINTRQTYQMQDNLSKLQENGRFAMDFISKDIRMAGYRGCKRNVSISSILNSPTSFLYDFNTAIQGFESTSSTAWTPAILDANIPSALGGSDIITLRVAGPQSYYVTTHGSGANNLTLSSATGLSTGDIVLVAACGTSNPRAFQISAITGNVLSHAASGTPGNATQSLIEDYATGEVLPINTISYFIRTNPNGEPSLYRRTGSSDSTELVEGIVDMQILYGEDTDFDPTTGASTDYVPNYYVKANAVVNMTRVISMRISLTARTFDNHLTSSGDGRIYRTFTSTIVVRNRLQ